MPTGEFTEHIFRHIVVGLLEYFCKVFGIDMHYCIIVLFLLVIVIACVFYLCRYLYRIIIRYNHNRKKLKGIKIVLHEPKTIKAQQDIHVENMSLEEAKDLFEKTFGNADEFNET